MLPGAKISHYSIVERIGAGGMGEVFLAEDTLLQRMVALKFLAPSYLSDTAFRDRFIREARAAAKLNHPNVVTIYEVGDDKGVPFLAMEYVSGKSIGELIKSRDTSLDSITDCALQIAAGVAEAHSAGIVHRDLKPENIKMTDSGRVKILDFGLAKILTADSVDEQGRIEGTLMYMSPEQVSGRELSFSTDIFSFGVVMYELVSGTRPFKGDSATAIMYSILHEDPEPPSEYNRDLPRWVDYFTLKLLAKNPADRFSDMRAASDFLKSAGKQEALAIETSPVKVRRKTVTVIDLKNLSGDPAWEYFCVGFTEDLIREVSRRTDLIVSAEPAGSQSRNIREVFKRCRSDFAITGTLMKWLDKFRLSLSVYSEGGDKVLFGEKYEGASETLFDILTSAARDVSVAFVERGGASQIDIGGAITADVTAYDYYLKGRAYYQTNRPEDLEFAAKMFSKTLELDTGFALALTGLSDVHAFQYMAYYDRTPEKIELARVEATRALAMNPRLPEAHRSLGRYYMFTGDFKKAENCFLTAIEIFPKYAVGYRTVAWLKEMIGDHESALEWAKKSLELAPTDLETLLLLSLIYMDEKKYTLALSTLLRATELGPDYGRAYYSLGTVYLKLGVLELALENFLLAIKYKGEPNSYIDAGYIYIANGDYESAKKQFLQSRQEGCLSFIAVYHMGLAERLSGNRGVAAEYFREALRMSEECSQKDPGNNLVASYKALCLAMLGKFPEAEVLIPRIAASAEHEGEVLLNLARCYAALGKQDMAEAFKKRSLTEHAGPSEKELAIDPHFSLRD
jgi:serine/threonine protein kinase/Flp pilus assembly protein TadD